MADVMFLAILTAFFALCVVFVKACERIIGPDVEASRADAPAEVEADPDDTRAAA